MGDAYLASSNTVNTTGGKKDTQMAVSVHEYATATHRANPNVDKHCTIPLNGKPVTCSGR